MKQLRGILQLSHDLGANVPIGQPSKSESQAASNEHFFITIKPVAHAMSQVLTIMSKPPVSRQTMVVRMMDSDFEVEKFEDLSPLKNTEIPPKSAAFSNTEFTVLESNPLRPLTQAKANLDSHKPQQSTAFDFEDANDLLDNKKIVLEEKRKNDVDKFEKQLQHLFSGQVPQEYAEKIQAQEMGQNKQPVAAQPLPNATQSSANQSAIDPHAFFNQISQARSQAPILDLGTFEARMHQFDAFDNALEKNRHVVAQQQSMPHKVEKHEPVVIPDAVTLSPLELVEDLDQMGVKNKKSIVESAQLTATEAPRPQQNMESNIQQHAVTEGSYISCECVISEPPHTVENELNRGRDTPSV